MHQMHDHLFKLVMRTKSEARRFLQHFVTPEVIRSLDLDSLKLSPDTIVDQKLSQYYTDVTYHCKTKQKADTQISFLFEHKSYPDRNTLLQVFYYQAAEYWKKINDKEQPELVIPIILVHGKRNFTVTPLEEVFGLKGTVLVRYLPSAAYEYLNVNQLKPADLDPVRATYLISMLLAFKGNGNKEQLLTSIAEIFKFVKAHEDDLLEETFMYALVTYIVQIYKLKQEDMNDIQTQIPKLAMPHFRDAGFNIWHEGHEEGMKKGIEQGIEQGIKKGVEIGKVEKEMIKIHNKLDFVVNLLCDLPMITDRAKAKLAGVKLEFVTQVRQTFTRRSIKQRKEEFHLFYQEIEGLQKNNLTEIKQHFEVLQKKIKASKTKLTAKEKK